MFLTKNETLKPKHYMTNDILEQIKAGDVSGVQFKERAIDKYDIGCKLLAFSNARGGKEVGSWQEK